MARRLGADFERLWAAYSVSAIGSALSSGALALIAITRLHVAAWQVSALVALAGIASAVIALPFGGWIEYRRKRPVMIGADLVRALATISVPASTLTGRLTYPLLCAVAVINSAAAIAFMGAGSAHLKGLLPASDLTAANSRLETTNWLSNTAGSSAGGLLISVFGSSVTLALDAASYLLSAIGVARIHAPEPPPPIRAPADGRREGLTAGWAYMLARRDLRRLLANSQVFGTTIMAAAPLTVVLMLTTLHFKPWQYGLAIGLPCLGGVLGAAITPRLVARFGLRPVMLASGVLRAPWLLLTPLAPAGSGGLVLLVAADFGLLACAGVFNPTFATYRLQRVEDRYLTRVTTAWSITSRTTQPLAIVAAGVLATVLGVRPTLAISGGLCLSSALLLPWPTTPTTPGVMSPPP